MYLLLLWIVFVVSNVVHCLFKLQNSHLGKVAGVFVCILFALDSNPIHNIAFAAIDITGFLLIAFTRYIWAKCQCIRYCLNVITENKIIEDDFWLVYNTEHNI
eukprot:155411_1